MASTKLGNIVAEINEIKVKLAMKLTGSKDPGVDLEGGGCKGCSCTPLHFFLLIIIHIIHCYTNYFNLQAGVKMLL